MHAPFFFHCPCPDARIGARGIQDATRDGQSMPKRRNASQKFSGCFLGQNKGPNPGFPGAFQSPTAPKHRVSSQRCWGTAWGSTDSLTNRLERNWYASCSQGCFYIRTSQRQFSAIDIKGVSSGLSTVLPAKIYLLQRQASCHRGNKQLFSLSVSHSTIFSLFNFGSKKTFSSNFLFIYCNLEQTPKTSLGIS